MKSKALTVAGLLTLVLLFVATGLRFVNITQSPPGFYIDEAAISAQVLCVQQSGENLQRESWPLITPVLGGGYATPTYLYPAVAWTEVFGDSIASFRSYTAFISVLFIAGMFVFGRRFWGTVEAGALCALAAAISPWAFQFARIAWDPAVAPAYTAWAFALLWSRRRTEIIASGVLFSLAAYSYPPLRVQLAITLPFAMIVLFRRRKVWKPYVGTIVVATIVSLPLIAKTLSGEIQGRFAMLSVFNPQYLKSTFGNDSFFTGFNLLIHNFVLLLSPRYLFVSGDGNLRHSTGEFGIWSYLDGLALFVAFVCVVLIVTKRTQLKPSKFRPTFVITGYLAGILPAAMTWESNPHALRSFGAVVFLALGTGGALSLMWQHSRAMRSAVVGMAFVSFLMFVHVYFVNYPPRAKIWFDSDVTELAHTLELENRTNELESELLKRGNRYDSMAIMYYRLASGAQKCPIR